MPRIDMVKLNVAAVDAARAALLMSCAELIHESGVSQATVTKARSGGAIALITARKIAKALKINVRDIVVECTPVSHKPIGAVKIADGPNTPAGSAA